MRQVVERREWRAIREPRLRGHDRRSTASASGRDTDDVSGRAPQLGGDGSNIELGWRLEGRAAHLVPVVGDCSCEPFSSWDFDLSESPAVRIDEVSAFTQSIWVVWMCLLIGADFETSVVPDSGITR